MSSERVWSKKYAYELIVKALYLVQVKRYRQCVILLNERKDKQLIRQT